MCPNKHKNSMAILKLIYIALAIAGMPPLHTFILQPG